MKPVKDVDEYIALASKEVQGKLKEIRAAIKATAPQAHEKISYGMPYYHYKGRLVYFAYAKHHIGLYALPGNIKEHKDELKKYLAAKATLHFALDEKLPIPLIKKLVKAQMKINESKDKK